MILQSTVMASTVFRTWGGIGALRAHPLPVTHGLGFRVSKPYLCPKPPQAFAIGAKAAPAGYSSHQFVVLGLGS